MKREEFDAERSAIDQAAGEIIAEIDRLKEAVTTAAAAKGQAKDSYEKAFDAGDERGMKAALAKIRESNASKEAAEAALRSDEIRNRIQSLHDREQVLAREIGPMRERAEAATKAARTAHDDVELCRGRLSAAFAQIVAADDRLTASLDAITGPVMPPRREGGPVVTSHGHAG